MRDEVASAILDHYEEFDEDERLRGAFGELEFVRTREVIRDGLPDSTASVLDLGGATGAYSFWMAELGHHVDLVDLVPRHVDAARARQTSVSFTLRSIEEGDARSLNQPDETYEAVVLHGPLYHLCARADRLSVLSECARVLKPGGCLMAFSINRYAGLFYALSQGLLFDDTYRSMIRSEMQTGIRENRPSGSATFSTAYFHKPDELLAEVRSAGFTDLDCGGVAGPVWQHASFESSWREPDRRKILLETSREVASEPAISPSICVRARKAAAV